MKRSTVSILFSFILLCVSPLVAQEKQLQPEDLLELARQGRLQQVTAQRLEISGSYLEVDSNQMQDFTVQVPNEQEMQSLASQLDQMGVVVEIRPDDEGFLMWVLLGAAALAALAGGLWLAFPR